MPTEPAILIAAAALLGLLVGSFLNVVIHRLPRMLERDWRAQCEELAGREPATGPAYNLLVPRSHCPACLTPVRAIHLIPILGWLLARGRCAACGAAVSPRYPVVEALTAETLSSCFGLDLALERRGDGRLTAWARGASRRQPSG